MIRTLVVNVTDPKLSPGTKLQEFTMGGGCFWCQDAIFRRVRGVSFVESGYTGGHTTQPHYEAVCSGTTGHAEAVKVRFDPEVVPADVILDMFFASHNPTTLNRQGYDVGTQYRSSLFAQDAAQRKVFEEAIRRHQSVWSDPIVTTIEPASTWYPAEEVHQDFYTQRPDVGYCQVIINPKLARVRKDYSAWLR